mmetsp:Transcript_4773/g.10193  ORF Transcript_4773/g.10193 Transcript_4773/m.10193 type:complete len:258 (+) Transcript_4773:484-1257(+)
MDLSNSMTWRSSCVFSTSLLSSSSETSRYDFSKLLCSLWHRCRAEFCRPAAARTARGRREHNGSFARRRVNQIVTALEPADRRNKHRPGEGARATWVAERRGRTRFTCGDRHTHAERRDVRRTERVEHLSLRFIARQPVATAHVVAAAGTHAPQQFSWGLLRRSRHGRHWSRRRHVCRWADHHVDFPERAHVAVTGRKERFPRDHLTHQLGVRIHVTVALVARHGSRHTRVRTGRNHRITRCVGHLRAPAHLLRGRH